MKVVAHHPTLTSVVLWIRSGRNERGWTVEVRRAGSSDVVHLWSRRPPDTRLPNVVARLAPYEVWTEPVLGLKAGTHYEVFVVTQRRLDRQVARFDTLPQHLPLRVLVASCYYPPNDIRKATKKPLRAADTANIGRVRRFALTTRLWVRSAWSVLPRRGAPERLQGGVGRRYAKLYADPTRRPHLKILMGDQVYLDNPVPRFFRARIPAETVGRWVAQSYQQSWEKLGAFLTSGANVCISDDHEFWNDYPNEPQRLWRALRDDETRATFADLASSHRTWMQLPRATTKFTVGPSSSEPELAVFVADTRVDRTPTSWNSPRFMSDAALRELLMWIAALTSPGLLVLGQPLIVHRSGRFDNNLRSFADQYRQLCAALIASEHDIVLACGDVHFGRVTTIAMSRTGRRHVEVIASPLSLVDGAGALGGSGLSEALRSFPPGTSDARATSTAVYSVPGAGGADICEDNAMTLEFIRGPDGTVALKVSALLVRRADHQTGGPKVDWSGEFELS